MILYTFGWQMICHHGTVHESGDVSMYWGWYGDLGNPCAVNRVKSNYGDRVSML